jgi:hypothetical protein
VALLLAPEAMRELLDVWVVARVPLERVRTAKSEGSGPMLMTPPERGGRELRL